MGPVSLKLDKHARVVSDRTKQATTRSINLLVGLYPGQPLLAFACILASLFLNSTAFGLEQGVPYISPVDPVNEYLDAIESIEEDYGPYDSQLSDLYIGLGQSLMDQEEYEKARDAFYRGVMVKRVNLGPNSLEQTNHLYLLATIETMLGDSDAADEVLENIYFINENHYGEDSPEMLPVLERMYQWYMVARPPGSLQLDYYDYKKVLDLAEDAADISEESNGEGHPDTAIAYKRLADAQFQMLRHLTGSGMPVTPENYVATTSGNQTPLGFGADPVYEHYNDARKAYKKYLDSLAADESTTPVEYAEALAELGDWCLVLDRRRQSRTFYEYGYQVLAQNEGFEEQARSFMSQPKPMHFVNSAEPIYLEELPPDLQQISLDVSMTVTNLGEVRSVEVLKAPEGISKGDLNRIKKRLLLTPFRPAMREGEVVTTKEFLWRYEIAPHGSAS